MACPTTILTLPNGAKFCAVDNMKCLYGKTVMRDGTIVCALPGMAFLESRAPVQTGTTGTDWRTTGTDWRTTGTDRGTTGTDRGTTGTATTGTDRGTMNQTSVARADTTTASTVVDTTASAAAQSILNLTNQKRATSAGTQPLTWNPELAALAQQRADANLKTSMERGSLSLVHGDLCLASASPTKCAKPTPTQQPPPNVGQNLAIETGSSPANAARSAVDGWYNEKSIWDNTKGDTFVSAAGHYTQLMWKGTKEVGCAVAIGKLGNQSLVSTACDYTPYGNVTGGFRTNVDAPLNAPK